MNIWEQSFLNLENIRESYSVTHNTNMNKKKKSKITDNKNSLRQLQVKNVQKELDLLEKKETEWQSHMDKEYKKHNFKSLNELKIK